MLHPTIANENGKTHYREMVKRAENYRKANKFNKGSIFRLPKLNRVLLESFCFF